eukprot:Pgem_evm1s13072
MQSTSMLEEWALAFLDRLFIACEHYLQPNKKSSKNGFDADLVMTCHLLFCQMSKEIHLEATRRVFKFVTSKLLIAAKKPVGSICSATTEGFPEQSLNTFFPFLADRIIDFSDTENEDDVEPDIEMIWDLHMIGQ